MLRFWISSTLLQASYSLDLASSYFFLFPWIKKGQERKQFDMILVVQAAAMRYLNNLAQKDLQEDYVQWKKMEATVC